MITGDHVATAAAIAHEVGIDGRAVTGRELDAMDAGQLAREVEGIGVFARVTPEHKVAIVEALTGLGHVVAMTGDGVNDAAALRTAHVGVAMGRTGTDVTKEAADLVLTDDNFATIVGAIRNGRGIFDNIVTFIRSQLTTNIAAILTFVVAVLAGLPAPMTAVQVLWVNLLTDGPPALALGLDRPSRHVMDRAPRPSEERILSAPRLVRMLGTALVMVAGTIGALVVARDEPVDYAVTLAFTTFVLLQVAKAMHVRSENASAFSRDPPVNRLLVGSLAGIVLLQVAVVNVPWLRTAFDTVPLSAEHWAFATCVAVAALALGEGANVVRRRRR
jgi:Ca2+-transporting ATPase